MSMVKQKDCDYVFPGEYYICVYRYIYVSVFVSVCVLDSLVVSFPLFLCVYVFYKCTFSVGYVQTVTSAFEWPSL